MEPRLDSFREKAQEILGMRGTMISGSKSGYRRIYPDNFPIFNSNICVREGKIWYGDIDLTVSIESLQKLCLEIEEPIYVLHEMDARFEHEEKPLLNKAAVIVFPDRVVLREDYHKLCDSKTFKLFH
jgi:hypothetical protein